MQVEKTESRIEDDLTTLMPKEVLKESLGLSTVIIDVTFSLVGHRQGGNPPLNNWQVKWHEIAPSSWSNGHHLFDFVHDYFLSPNWCTTVTVQFRALRLLV
jgi:hypothetical protein